MSGHYVTHGPFEYNGIGETWYKDPNTGEIHYAWSSSLITNPEVLGPVGTPRLGGISILPPVVRAQAGDARTLRVLGIERDGVVSREIDVTTRVSWTSSDDSVAFARVGVVHAKKLGLARVSCQLDAFSSSAEVVVRNYARGDRAVYFQGLRRLQQLRFDHDDNLYVCNQSPSVYRIARDGGFEEVVRLAMPDTYPGGADCIAVDQNATLYVNDMPNERFLRFRRDGNKYSPPEPFGLSVPGTKKGIAVDSIGTIFACVVGSNNRGFVIRLENNGRESVFETQDVAFTIATDMDGFVYVPSGKTQSIHVYDNDGRFVHSTPYIVNDTMSDILIDPAGTVYLAFSYTGMIVRIPRGKESAGGGEVVAKDLGVLGGIAMNSLGRLYVSNFDGNSIEMVY